ncbi:unnamed protein product [Rangifer tarandus platyrhynchus]|uniref:Uncharacterized protein n=1 Tax=Rangifer tarandus platyrhynchus TaxID=3082113 RepID=A0ABN8ZS34_RANTA|nr:unnamed protein product [Rangifer tarandus platyrhynchus]
MAPGRRLRDSRRCWALRPRAAQGPEASGREEAERRRGGAAARGGAGVAETRGWRPRTLRAFARRTVVARNRPECPAQGWGPAGEEPCQRCPRALDQAPKLPAPALTRG